MLTITRKFEWDSGHRVLGHEGKCRHLHGHRYVAEVTVTAPELNKLGMVIDFSILKTVVGKWIDDNWDHNLLLNAADPMLDIPPTSAVWGGKKPYIMPVGNPTAEMMASCLHSLSALLLLPYEMIVTKIRVYETPNCYADYQP